MFESIMIMYNLNVYKNYLNIEIEMKRMNKHKIPVSKFH